MIAGIASDWKVERGRPSQRRSSKPPVSKAWSPAEEFRKTKGPLSPEGDNAKKRRGRPSKAEKAARRGKSMGRFPLKAAVEEHLEREKLRVGAKTWNNKRRILRELADAMEEVRERGIIATTNPTRIGPMEIQVLISWMRDPKAHKAGKRLDLNTQDRYLRMLELVLEEHDNHVLQQMRNDGYPLPQRNDHKPIRTISEDNIARIRAAAEFVRSAQGEIPDWRKAKARMISSLYYATGLRPSELTKVRIDEVDLEEWTIHVSNPKGSDVYGRERDVTILPFAREVLQSFVANDRQQYIEDFGRKTATYLIPYLREGQDDHYSSNHFREIKAELEQISGVKFRLKDYRSSFASMLDDIDPNLAPYIQTQLGHSNEKTYRTFYAQIKAGKSGKVLEEAWSQKNRPQRLMTPGEDPAIGALLKRYGLTTIEELDAVMGRQVKKPENQRIEFSNPLSGYS